MLDSFMEEWLQAAKAGPQVGQHPVEWAARLHADFEIIHPSLMAMAGLVA